MVGRKFGSIYLNDEMVLPGAVYIKTPEITFGDTGPDNMSLSWVYGINGNFVATNCALINISWNNLNRQGYVSGRPVFIDGKGYLCRCLWVGQAEGENNEWDDLLDRYGDDPAFWGDSYCRFWGQELVGRGHSKKAVLRGGNSTRDRIQAAALNRNIGDGKDYKTYCFRPVLEPLRAAPTLDDDLVGVGLEVYGPSGTAIKGTLTGFDDYDLTIAAPHGLTRQTQNWVVRKRKSAIVSRDSIVWMRTIPLIPSSEGK